MARALLIVLDSVGIGGAPDADAYGDAGSDTLGHIARACAEGRGDRPGLRTGPLSLPNLARLGLGHAAAGATGRIPPGLAIPHPPEAAHGHAVERAAGKDTPSGHWEIAGVPVPEPWGHFPVTVRPSRRISPRRWSRGPGCPASSATVTPPAPRSSSGWERSNLRTGRPICYTSADSVFQIAAHEVHFGLEHLYATCRIARDLCDPYRIGRVIARPFVGDAESGFRRTANRKDYAVEPPGRTLLDHLAEAGRDVVSVGKIGDIFAHRATGREIKPAGNAACLDAALDAFATLEAGGLVFLNLVDFDTEYGHRRDVPGYAAELEAFDARVPGIRAALRPGDLCIITADHGNDPTWTGTEHTREQVPILAFGPGIAPRAIGRRETFADIGATLARHLGSRPWRRDVLALDRRMTGGGDSPCGTRMRAGCGRQSRTGSAKCWTRCLSRNSGRGSRCFMTRSRGLKRRAKPRRLPWTGPDPSSGSEPGDAHPDRVTIEKQFPQTGDDAPRGCALMSPSRCTRERSCKPGG